MGATKSQKNISKNLEPIFGNPQIELKVYYGSDDLKKAIIEIPKVTVKAITLTEGIYESLPHMSIIVEDTGNFFHNISFDIGEYMYVSITPKFPNPDIITYPYLEVKYKIVGLKQIVSPKKTASYTYEIFTVFPAEEYLNSTFIWPDDTLDPTNLWRMYTSVDLLRRVVPKCGLKFSNLTGMPTFDIMTWYNYNKTFQEFIDYVLDHAWLGDDDAPMFYINRYGQGCLDSIKSMKSKASLATYMNDSLYRKKYAKEIAAAKKQNSKANDLPYKRLFNIKFETTNLGYYQNTGAYGAETSVYCPMNMASTVNPLILKPVLLKLKEVIYEDFENRKATSSVPPQPYVGNVSNFSNQIGNKRYRSQEFAFVGNHMNFDVAPLHNNNLVKSFPQLFAYITIDSTKQLSKDAKTESRPDIGDKITIDFSTINNDKSSNIGEYIIGGIVHHWEAGTGYSQTLCCISDGTPFNHNRFVQEKKKSLERK